MYVRYLTKSFSSRIVRDYEKYIARQFKRGTSRQELNVSWLKKNELDLKRHVQDLRDNIRTNWTTTGQELSKELRQYWPASRPQSPAPGSRLALPTTPGGANGDINLREAVAMAAAAKSPTTPGGQPNEFITGYTLGLIGGVRSWVRTCRSSTFTSHRLTFAQQMTKSRRNVRDVSRAASDDESEESDDKGNERGRQPAASTS